MQVSLFSLDRMRTGEADDGSHGGGGAGADDLAAAAVLPGPPELVQPWCNQRPDRSWPDAERGALPSAWSVHSCRLSVDVCVGGV